MNTLAKQKTNVAHHATKQFTSPITKETWDNLETNRFGIIPIVLTLIACIGGVAAAFGTHYDAFQIAVIAFPTVICLSMVLSVSPMKWIIYSGVMAILFDLLVFLF